MARVSIQSLASTANAKESLFCNAKNVILYSIVEMSNSNIFFSPEIFFKSQIFS